MSHLKEGDEFYTTEISRTRYRYSGRRNDLVLSRTAFGADPRPYHRWERADGKGTPKKGYDYGTGVWVERT